MTVKRYGVAIDGWLLRASGKVTELFRYAEASLRGSWLTHCGIDQAGWFR
jgi:hypothetical protein